MDDWLQCGLYLLYILVLTILPKASNQLVNVYVVIVILSRFKILFSFYLRVSRLYQIYLYYFLRRFKTRLFRRDRAVMLWLIILWIRGLHFFDDDLVFRMLDHSRVPKTT